MSDTSPPRVTPTRQDAWQTSLDSAIETRASFGASTDGHHFRVESTNYDATPEWSRAYASPEQAQREAGKLGEAIRGDAVPTYIQREAARTQVVAQASDAVQTVQRQTQELRPNGATL